MGFINTTYISRGSQVNSGALDAWQNMPQATVFYYHGHAGPGKVHFADYLGTEIYATGATMDTHAISEYAPGAFNKMWLAIFIGCESGCTDGLLGNLIDSTTSHGAETALGFNHSISVDQAQQWSNVFMDQMSSGCTVTDAANHATYEVDINPIYYLPGKGGDGGVNSWKISGNPDCVLPNTGGLPIPNALGSAGIENSIDSTTLESMKNNVESFLGKPDANLSVSNIIESPMGKEYVISSGDDEYYINANTHKVEAIYSKNKMKNSNNVKKNMQQAEDIAKAYGTQKFDNFTEKISTMQLTNAELIDHGTAGKEYKFIWTENINGTYTLNRIVTSVNANNGDIISYMVITRSINISLEPNITEQEAIGIANKYFNEPLINTTIKVGIIYCKDGSQKLAWIVQCDEEPKDGFTQGGILSIDAKSGKIIAYNPYE